MIFPVIEKMPPRDLTLTSVVTGIVLYVSELHCPKTAEMPLGIYAKLFVKLEFLTTLPHNNIMLTDPLCTIHFRIRHSPVGPVWYTVHDFFSHKRNLFLKKKQWQPDCLEEYIQRTQVLLLLTIVLPFLKDFSTLSLFLPRVRGPCFSKVSWPLIVNDLARPSSSHVLSRPLTSPTSFHVPRPLTSSHVLSRLLTSSHVSHVARGTWSFGIAAWDRVNYIPRQVWYN